MKSPFHARCNQSLVINDSGGPLENVVEHLKEILSIMYTMMLTTLHEKDFLRGIINVPFHAR